MTKLKQLDNKLEIIGTLKSKNLEYRTTMDGRQYITGNIIITSKINDVTHDFMVKVFSMNTQRSFNIFKGIQTVLNEYKSIDQNGEENADYIRVLGSLKYVHYESVNGEVKEYNEIKGNYFTRLDNKEEGKALMEIGTVVEGYTIHNESDKLQIKGFNVAYNNEVVILKNCFVQDEVVDVFKNFYPVNSTGRLICSLSCPTLEQVPTHAFGATFSIAKSTQETNDLLIEVIGGDIPFEDDRKYTAEKIKLAKKKLEEKLQEQKHRSSAHMSAIPTTGTGF